MRQLFLATNNDNVQDNLRTKKFDCLCDIRHNTTTADIANVTCPPAAKFPNIQLKGWGSYLGSMQNKNIRHKPR